MKARMFGVDDLAHFERKGSGVRISGETLHTYDLRVVAADVGGVVAAAGGWLCDRVRAGWDVTVLGPPGHDVRALTILGVCVDAGESAAEEPGLDSAAAIAIDARVLSGDEQLRDDVLRLVDTARAEITVWGGSALLGADGRFSRVRHRLSAAARAFKARALEATGQPTPDLAVEEFVSAALWYPTDGADLVPHQ
ncbi:hypothetical protein [Mycolicibacterium austroafricanum]|uniref:hypothetical protein n=1 Tax=Mycolicibacterium austroafricanum TaxID=39687 RepID=UPI001F32046C|nr:hypothetical protein [Mycolicibacterium austroafricanum]